MTSGVVRHFRLLAGDTVPGVVELSGTVAGASAPVRALYVGSGANQDFLAALVMDNPQELPRRELGGYLRVPGVLAAAAKAGPAQQDAVLTDLPALWRFLTPAAAQFRFPAWVRQELKLPFEPAPWLLPRAVEREATRLARRHAYTVDFVEDEAWLRRFFHELYRPYVRARFGNGAILVSEREFLRKSKGGTLARLHREGEWIAGMLLERVRDTLRFGWFGTTENSPPPGASDVLDLACVRHAREAGVRRVQLGYSRPSLADGVVRYKAKLGARFVASRYPQAVLGITVQGRHTALLRRLDAQQLIAMRGFQVRVLAAS